MAEFEAIFYIFVSHKNADILIYWEIFVNLGRFRLFFHNLALLEHNRPLLADNDRLFWILDDLLSHLGRSPLLKTFEKGIFHALFCAPAPFYRRNFRNLTYFLIFLLFLLYPTRNAVSIFSELKTVGKGLLHGFIIFVVFIHLFQHGWELQISCILAIWALFAWMAYILAQFAPHMATWPFFAVFRAPGWIIEGRVAKNRLGRLGFSCQFPKGYFWLAAGSLHLFASHFRKCVVSDPLGNFKGHVCIWRRHSFQNYVSNSAIFLNLYSFFDLWFRFPPHFRWKSAFEARIGWIFYWFEPLNRILARIVVLER